MDFHREGAGGGHDDRYASQRVAGAGDESGLAGTGASTPHDEARMDGGSESRGADVQGRRRVLIARVGEGIGLDLSPVIDVLFRGEACDGGEDGLASRSGMDQGCDGDEGEDGVSTDEDGSFRGASGTRCWARRGEQASAPRGRSVARGAQRGDRRRRDAASDALVRVPGHERKRPYNSFDRFLRMAEKTRHVFFSLGSGSVHDGAAASEPKHLEAPQQAGPDAILRQFREKGSLAPGGAADDQNARL
eukprot:g10465.t1